MFGLLIDRFDGWRLPTTPNSKLGMSRLVVRRERNGGRGLPSFNDQTHFFIASLTRAGRPIPWRKKKKEKRHLTNNPSCVAANTHIGPSHAQLFLLSPTRTTKTTAKTLWFLGRLLGGLEKLGEGDSRIDLIASCRAIAIDASSRSFDYC